VSVVGGGGTTVPDMQACMRINRRAAVLRGAILGRRCSLQVQVRRRSQDVSSGCSRDGEARTCKWGESPKREEKVVSRGPLLCVLV
jgi:hypothetical protein